jgi:hypothetical protein
LPNISFGWPFVFWDRVFSSWLRLFVMGFSFFSLVNNQPGSKGITEPYKGKSGKTYTAKQDRKEHIV